MPKDWVEKHQVAGVDERARGFNRVVEIRQVGQGYRAVLQYETRQVSTEGCESEQAALQMLIRRLHAEGFTQLRSQLSFRGAVYLGSREPWIEYPDPAVPRFKGLLARWFGRWFGQWLGRTGKGGLP